MSEKANIPPPAEWAWGDHFLLGYGPMDSVHQEFVECVAALRTGTPQQWPALLDRFAEHARAHFESEDQWMRETEFPARDCHIEEHAAVLKSVEEVRALAHAGNVSEVPALTAELVRWFPGHADYLDSALAHWMFKRRHGGKPIVLRRDAAKAADTP